MTSDGLATVPLRTVRLRGAKTVLAVLAFLTFARRRTGRPAPPKRLSPATSGWFRPGARRPPDVAREGASSDERTAGAPIGSTRGWELSFRACTVALAT